MIEQENCMWTDKDIEIYLEYKAAQKRGEVTYKVIDKFRVS